MKSILKILKINVLVVLVAVIYSGCSDNEPEVVLSKELKLKVTSQKAMNRNYYAKILDISDDGRYVAYQEKVRKLGTDRLVHSKVWVEDTKKKGLTLIRLNKSVGQIGQASLSPSGNYIYISYRTNSFFDNDKKNYLVRYNIKNKSNAKKSGVMKLDKPYSIGGSGNTIKSISDREVLVQSNHKEYRIYKYNFNTKRKNLIARGAGLRHYWFRDANIHFNKKHLRVGSNLYDLKTGKKVEKYNLVKHVKTDDIDLYADYTWDYKKALITKKDKNEDLVTIYLRDLTTNKDSEPIFTINLDYFEEHDLMPQWVCGNGEFALNRDGTYFDLKNKKLYAMAIDEHNLGKKFFERVRPYYLTGKSLNLKRLDKDCTKFIAWDTGLEKEIIHYEFRK